MRECRDRTITKQINRTTDSDLRHRWWEQKLDLAN